MNDEDHQALSGLKMTSIVDNESLRASLKHELMCQHQCEDAHKDIIVVAHNGLEHLRKCVKSVLDNTRKCTLHIWDNASDDETSEYIDRLPFSEKLHTVGADWKISKYKRSETNLGFIRPNNILVEKSSSPYIILLNSDTVVHRGWDLALLGYLQLHPEVSQVGYMGGLLDKDGSGIAPASGSKIDYVHGWCFCIRRETYEKHGLFDEQAIEFAYFEDADFSLRLKQQGEGIYAMHLHYVDHHGEATSQEVKQELDLDSIYYRNQEAFADRWGSYIRENRVLANRDAT